MPRFDGELSFHWNFVEHQRVQGRRLVYEEDAFQVWENIHCRRVVRNPQRRGKGLRRRAPYKVLGCTNLGRYVAMPIFPVDARQGNWMAYSAWWI